MYLLMVAAIGAILAFSGHVVLGSMIIVFVLLIYDGRRYFAKLLSHMNKG